MPFGVTWDNLLGALEDLPSDATLQTPLSDQPFRITDIQQHRVLIEYRDDAETIPLQRDQFETLTQRVEDAAGDGFELDRLPPDAEPYATVLSVHPRFEIDQRDGIITESDTPAATPSPLVESGSDAADSEAAAADDRAEPDLAVYSDALLLIDALERHDPTDLDALETPTLVNLYTLLSDVQRNANDFRTEVADALLARLQHDQPVAGQYGSVQRTTRRRRNLKDEDEVLQRIEQAGLDRERVMGVDSDRVDDALDVTTLSESDVYEIEETAYVRKAEVDDDVKETRLQGLKDRLAASDSDHSEELRREVEELEARIEELTSFESGQAFHTSSMNDP